MVAASPTPSPGSRPGAAPSLKLWSESDLRWTEARLSRKGARGIIKGYGQVACLRSDGSLRLKNASTTRRMSD